MYTICRMSNDCIWWLFLVGVDINRVELPREAYQLLVPVFHWFTVTHQTLWLLNYVIKPRSYGLVFLAAAGSSINAFTCLSVMPFLCTSSPRFITDSHDILPHHWKHLRRVSPKLSRPFVEFQGHSGKNSSQNTNSFFLSVRVISRRLVSRFSWFKWHGKALWS